MKLRNKKTGEIIDSDKLLTDKFILDLFSRDFDYFKSKLHKIQDEWEDYEEPKEYWCITWSGDVDVETDDGFDVDKSCKEIGNYFLSREEAEKTVEKLKAWKRLEDKGFRFTGVAGISNNIFVSFETDSKYSGGHVMYDEYSNTDNKLKEYNEDLTLLFGGEE